MEKQKNITSVAIFGVILVSVVLTLGTFLTGHKAKQDTENAVTSVSLLYLDELAGRREQVVSSALERNIENMRAAISLLTEDDLSNIEHLQEYQARMKKLYTLEKFAFVDDEGLIYTSLGVMDDIDEYNINYSELSEPFITVKEPKSEQKKVIIAIPVNGLYLEGKKLVVCFMEIDMEKMLEGVSLISDNNGTTFCNIYTKDGVALTNMVLGGLASEDNLLDAMGKAEFENGMTAEKVRDDFENKTHNYATFTYDGIQETLSYVPIKGTDWMLTYLIRNSVISENISSVSDGIIARSLIQTIATATILLVLFSILLMQSKKNAALAVEKEATEIENKIKQQELVQRLELQEKLLEQEKNRTQQDNMISALSSDYISVYYADLQKNECICYRSTVRKQDGPQAGDHFEYRKAFEEYAANRVSEKYRKEFLDFTDPKNIIKRLETNPLLTYRYLVSYNGKEVYEMLRIAGMDKSAHEITIGFTDIDAEMRETMKRNQALSDALKAAEEASKAKTVFLSSMSHEIRTPMNAIIGLDSIALNDPEISDKTRGYLEKIGSSANHLLSLINDILDMSRIEAGRMTLKSEEFSFAKLIEQVNTIFSTQCAEKGLDYNCHINGTVDDYFIGDNIKLRQVLVNILGNAVKFTPEGGKIDFITEKVNSFDGRSTLRFKISDTGIGMSREYLPHIFDTFSQEDSTATNRYGSSGLGLAITKNIVEMMNGNIDVQSEKGRGTTFIFTVTLIDSDHKQDNKDDEIYPYKMNVLVVDDDPIACEHAKLVLEKTGMSCETALSGKEALEKVKLHQARQKPYDLILVDLKMPEMDGVETSKRIREIVGRESAIIIITAYRWDDVFDEAKKAGVDSFIAKPLFAGNVIEEYRSARKKKKPSDTLHKVSLKGRRVLLAEDVPINAEIMTMLLTTSEMIVDHAENGKIALQKFSDSPEGFYDVILMDIRMPEMDGLEATAKIRGLNRKDAESIPIIALTANAFDEDVHRSLQAGMNAHLSKPIDSNALFAALESLITE